MEFSLIAFFGVGLDVLGVAIVALIVLVLALLAASANVFFRGVARFDDDALRATMDLSPAQRRRFYEIYASWTPKSPAVAWFLALALGPAGVNLYRGRPFPCIAAILSLNGLGAWWLESWFTSPQLVLIENRALVARTLSTLDAESRPNVLALVRTQ